MVRRADWALVALALTTLSAAAVGSYRLAWASAGPSASTSDRVVKIIADEDGFSPSSVQVKKGEHVTLEFLRITERTCAKSVVFPELGLTKPLPLKQPVSIAVPTDQARKLTFQCGMGMYKSSVVIQ